MPALFLAAVPLFILLAGAAAAAQPSTPPGAADDVHRTVVLDAMGQRVVPELRISPGILTALLFGSPLKLAGVELEAQGLFSRMTVLEDALLLVPSKSLNAGRILRLKVRFVDGVVPASADFLLVVDPLQAEHQVNVELQQPMADTRWLAVEEERAKTQECRAELERMQRRPDGLTGLIANGQLADKGVTARRALREKDFIQRPGDSPSGIYGAELEYRILPNLGLNVSGGSGMWGVRVGPHVRFYPLGEVPLSPFLEAGTSFNFGGGTWVEVDGVRRDGDMLFTSVATLAVGSRLSLGRLFFVSSRVGWGWRLRQDNFQMRDGQSPDVLTDTAISLIQHGGFLFSGTLGVSFF